jgi:hypothetical protein
MGTLGVRLRPIPQATGYKRWLVCPDGQRALPVVATAWSVQLAATR